MADYLVQGNKTVKCMGCKNWSIIPFQTTVYKCPCGHYTFYAFYGVVSNDDNYIY